MVTIYDLHLSIWVKLEDNSLNRIIRNFFKKSIIYLTNDPKPLSIGERVGVRGK